jgi:hypothetical protein
MELPDTPILPADELARIREVLRENDLVPDSCLAVFIGGSVARGWQHRRSDIDFYAICEKPWDGETSGVNPVALHPNVVPTHGTFIDGERIEIRYWLDSQVDQVLAKTTWDQFRNGDPLGREISRPEAAFLSRLAQSITILDTDWMHRRRKQLMDSAFRSMWILRWLGAADGHVRDALGMLESGDHHSAALSAQMALAASVDALTLSHNEYSLDAKWRARRLRAINSETVSFEQYWELFTMASFDAGEPHEWIETVLELCRRIALDVEV